MSVQISMKTMKQAIMVVKGRMDMEHFISNIERQGIRRALATVIAKTAVAKVA